MREVIKDLIARTNASFIDFYAVQLDPVAGLDERRQAGDLTVDPHPAGADQLLGAPARGDSGTREVGVQAHLAIIDL